MSKWVDILKKNDKEFETTLKNEDVVIEDNESIIVEEDYNIKDYDEEFDIINKDKLIDIKLEFEEYVKEKCLPFFNKNILMENPHNINITDCSNNYNFYDFMKYNSVNYFDLIKQVNKENDEYIKELENEENEFNDISDIEFFN